MIRDLLMRWAHAAEIHELRQQIRHLNEQLKTVTEQRDHARAVGFDYAAEISRLTDKLTDLQPPTPTADQIWDPEPGELVTGESLVLGADITGRFTRWHATGPYAVLDGGRRVIGRTLRPAEEVADHG